MAGGLHQTLLTLDAHLDVPVHFTRPGWCFGDRHAWPDDLSQVDLARMEDGNLSGGFFVIYTPQGPLTPEGYAAARAHALCRSDEIDATLARFADRIGVATTATQVEALHRAGKRVALKSVENSYPVGCDLAFVAELRRRGVRMAGAVHSRTNQLADSATDAPRWNGLSALGRDWVAAMNRAGIVIDPSHASDAAFDAMLDLSDTPLIASHSGGRAAFDHPRNLDDDRLRRLAQAGGVICFTTIYLSAMSADPAWRPLLTRLSGIGTLAPPEQAALAADWRAQEAIAPLWAAELDGFVAALLHVIDVVGMEHVGFGADFDGGGGFAGLDDVTALPRITGRLQRAGLSDDAIAQLWAGNILRVLRGVDDRIGTRPEQDHSAALA